jgi:hypothetical protein
MQKALDYAKSIVKDGETLIFSSSKALLTHDTMYYPRDLAMCSALGNSSGAIVMSFTRNGDIYSATMRYIVFDFYDWAENSNATGVPFLGITDGDLYKLHSAGWAKHFYVYGEVLVKIRGI